MVGMLLMNEHNMGLMALVLIMVTTMMAMVVLVWWS